MTSVTLHDTILSFIKKIELRQDIKSFGGDQQMKTFLTLQWKMLAFTILKIRLQGINRQLVKTGVMKVELLK